jgi:hypothetical protein
VAPIGIGTASVESLTGYVERLPDAHSVFVGSLVGKEICGFVNPEAIILAPVSYPVNGLGGSAKPWVQALEALTLQDDLR